MLGTRWVRFGGYDITWKNFPKWKLGIRLHRSGVGRPLFSVKKKLTVPIGESA